MARSSVWIGQDIPGVEGLAKQQRALAKLPDGLLEEIAPVLALGALRICATQKDACPVNDLDPEPGALRDSGHVENAETPSHIAKAVIFDATDDAGHYIGKHVENGHKAKDGSHVAPVPFFWPGYNHEKKGVKRDVGNAVNRGVKKRFGSSV